MKEGWHREKSKKSKRKTNNDNYSILDFFLDVLLWIPELIFLPLRLIYWLFRGIGRFIGDIFDFV